MGDMTVLLLDDRWPSQIPLAAHGRLGGPVTCTDEVPYSVCRHLRRLVPAEGAGVLVSTDARDPRVQARVDAGEPVIEAASRNDPVRRAVEAMSRARVMGEWEAGQTHRSLLPYLAEETQEFSEAVHDWERDGREQPLLSELGDVLLQVLFHAEIAARRGAFDLGDVAESFLAKLRSRSPYLFDGSTGMVGAQEQERLWQEGKGREGSGPA